MVSVFNHSEVLEGFPGPLVELTVGHTSSDPTVLTQKREQAPYTCCPVV